MTDYANKEYVNSGSLFVSKVKKNPKSPDYYGDALIDLDALGIGKGKHKIKLSGWKRTSSKNGTTFLSLSLGMFEEKQAGSQPAHDTNQDDPF